MTYQEKYFALYLDESLFSEWRKTLDNEDVFHYASMDCEPQGMIVEHRVKIKDCTRQELNLQYARHCQELALVDL